MIIKVQLNAENIIIGYSSIGDLSNSIEVELNEMPDDLCGNYKLENKKIVKVVN